MKPPTAPTALNEALKRAAEASADERVRAWLGKLLGDLTESVGEVAEKTDRK